MTKHTLFMGFLLPLISVAQTNPSHALIGALPVAGKIVSEKANTALQIVEWKLGNGAKVILKPTQFNPDQILFSVFSPGGTALYSDADFQSAANAASILTASGLGDHDAIGLSKLLSEKQISIQPTSVNASRVCRVEAVKQISP